MAAALKASGQSVATTLRNNSLSNPRRTLITVEVPIRISSPVPSFGVVRPSLSLDDCTTRTGTNLGRASSLLLPEPDCSSRASHQ
jgi:hypothetical protein